MAEWFSALDLKSGGPWFKTSILPLPNMKAVVWLGFFYFNENISFSSQAVKSLSAHDT